MAEPTKRQSDRSSAVVGGGIAGVQAALDLADSGVKVYLVEREPAIGGKMAQLDKTFPTNDCAMCILSPKLVEAGRHRNIEILTTSDLLGLEGEAGHFSGHNPPPATLHQPGGLHRLQRLRRGLPCRGPQRVQRGPVDPHGHLQALSPGRTQRLCHLQEGHQSLQGHLPCRHQRPGLYRPHCRAAVRRGAGSHQAVQSLPRHRGPRLPPSLRNRMQPGQAGQPRSHLRPETLCGRHGL